jgi:hypothetical protein
MADQFFNSSGQQIAVEDSDGKRFPVKATFDQYVITAATGANVNASASSVTLIAANTGRKAGSKVVNDSTAILYIKLGSTASATDYWAAIDGKTTVPGEALIPDGYLGIVTGIWASATGAARVVEMT